MIARFRRLTTGLTDIDDADFVDRLWKQCVQARIPLDEIQRLLRDHVVEEWDRLDSLPPEAVKFSKKGWLRQQKRIQKALARIRSRRNDLANTLTELFP